ncbi:MAG TPA: GH25 family lysozyme [Polyangia bacterium]
MCADGPVVKGMDVSHYDGTIDWAQAKASGIDFAFIKATENTSFVDPDFATNWKAAGAAGVIRGAYHFFRPEVDAVAQADFFVATAGVPARGDLPLALDLEVTDGIAGATVATGARQFLARVQATTGRVPVIYTSASFWMTMGSPAATGFSDAALWVANWTTGCPALPPAWSRWTFWQNTATGTVPGIAGTANVDLDQFNGSLAALQGYVDPGADGGVDGGGGDGGGGSDGGAVPSPHHGGCSVGGASDGELGAWGLAALVALVAGVARQRRGGRPFDRGDNGRSGDVAPRGGGVNERGGIGPVAGTMRTWGARGSRSAALAANSSATRRATSK